MGQTTTTNKQAKVLQCSTQVSTHFTVIATAPANETVTEVLLGYPNNTTIATATIVL